MYTSQPDGDFGYLLQQVMSRLVAAAKGDRGVVFLKEPNGTLVPRGGYDGEGEPIEVLLSHASQSLAEEAAWLRVGIFLTTASQSHSI